MPLVGVRYHKQVGLTSPMPTSRFPTWIQAPLHHVDNNTPSGTLTTMTSDDNETWRGTFTPEINAEDNSSRLSLATTYTDLAGNNGPDNQTENFEIDTLAPTVSVAFSSELTEGRQTLSWLWFFE